MGNWSKPWWKSRMIWVNVLTVLVGVVGVVQGSELIADNPEIVAGFVTAAGVLNVVLRAITKTPLTPK